ncbi:MAG: hypothetical protein M3Z09_13485, partial [Acidobacteriota bacterium]|nr:hypothetical protein [Acidobacteriota bacterium]
MKPLLLLFMLSVASQAEITFSRDIAAIVYEHCAPCHRQGDVAPFPLTSYSEVRRHASQIAAVTRSRYMPPWLPVPGVGDFAGSRRLPAARIE